MEEFIKDLLGATGQNGTDGKGVPFSLSPTPPETGAGWDPPGADVVGIRRNVNDGDRRPEPASNGP